MQEEITAKLQEIIKLAYLYNQQGPKKVWVYFSGHVNALGARIANFDGSFIDVELEDKVYLTTSEHNTDAEIISQLNAIIEKLHTALYPDEYCSNCKTEGGCRCDEMYEAARDRGDA